ncbi:hypothetical protein BD779DRAFT_1673599 [Infundibulicybe gibba]|nr:hypothetical protein BD779DRAFT_1673599 [Infundibulicybe gibba]
MEEESLVHILKSQSVSTLSLGTSVELTAIPPIPGEMKSASNLAIIAMLMATFAGSAIALPTQNIGEAQDNKDFFIPIFVPPSPPAIPSVSNSNNKNAVGGTANGVASGTVNGSGTIGASGGNASASNGRK